MHGHKSEEKLKVQQWWNKKCMVRYFLALKILRFYDNNKTKCDRGIILYMGNLDLRNVIICMKYY